MEPLGSKLKELRALLLDAVAADADKNDEGAKADAVVAVEAIKRQL